MNILKSRIRNGETLIGTFLSLGDPVATEIVAKAGFDWVLIDLEHGIGSEREVLHQMQALASTNVSPLVRVEGKQRQRIQKVLDLGVQGIVFPHIRDADDAIRCARSMRYAPEGLRGVSKMVRATNFGEDFVEYHNHQKENLLCVVQIETMQALDNLDQIGAVEDIDVFFIGPSDLSMALGIYGQLDHPKFLEAEAKIIEAAKKYRKAIGFLLFDPLDFQQYYNKGVRFFACGNDALFLKNGARAVAQKLKDAVTANVASSRNI
jgi:4-hydroxy-2-oxoheptanedioate aldolase